MFSKLMELPLLNYIGLKRNNSWLVAVKIRRSRSGSYPLSGMMKNRLRINLS